jgi:hypothetical protein
MTKNFKMNWAVAAFCIAGIAAACTDDKKATPSKIDVSDGGEGSGGASSQGGTTGASGNTSTTGGSTSAAGSTAEATGGAATGTAGATSVAGATGVAGAGAGCEDTTKNCYKCAPTTNAQVLRACTDATCIPFDNMTLTKIVNGTLPALP